MKKTLCIAGIIGILAAGGWTAGQGGRDISSTQAFRMLGQPDTYLVDVRTVAEYVYVGHPEKAYNIPLVFWDERNLQTVANESFIEDFRARFKAGDTLILICRSGNLSAHARRMLVREEFKNVFNIKDGFEGTKDRDGHRTLNGWKNEGLPYTYQLDPALLHSAIK